MGFDAKRFMAGRLDGHGALLGIRYHDAGEDWVELALPYAADLVGDPERGVIASGAIVTLMDMASSVAVWMKRDRFAAHATLDLRVDYLRAAVPGQTVIGRARCLRLTRTVAFVQGQAHDGDAADPVAQVAGTFMLTGA